MEQPGLATTGVPPERPPRIRADTAVPPPHLGPTAGRTPPPRTQGTRHSQMASTTPQTRCPATHPRPDPTTATGGHGRQHTEQGPLPPGTFTWTPQFVQAAAAPLNSTATQEAWVRAGGPVGSLLSGSRRFYLGSGRGRRDGWGRGNPKLK